MSAVLSYVAHVPVLDTIFVHAPSDDGDFVVYEVYARLHVVSENTTRVVQERHGIDAATDWSAFKNFVHHSLLAVH